MLGRLGVQQKLSLLLTLPLIAVIVISVPFSVGRFDDAMASSATVGSATHARAVAGLIQDLQEERLLTLTYLVSPDADRDAVRVAIAAASDRADQVTSSLHRPDDEVLLAALDALRRLDRVRQTALARTASPVEVDRTYHDLVLGLVTALNLTGQDRADATGLRQLAALDALLRINEDITRLGASLVIGTKDATVAGQMVAETLLYSESDIAHFRQQADDAQSALLGIVVQGQTAQRINEYARQITSGGLWVAATKALTAAEATLTLTRTLQERIVRDIATRADERAGSARTAAGTVVGFAVLLVLAVLLLSAAVSRSVARPLRRLTLAAVSVADLARTELVRVADSEVEQAGPPKLSAVQVTTSDEIGELATAFNRVQATAALMMEQQVATRRNVAVMFANIARRTRSLVSRQLNFIDDLERNEQNEELLAKLYRLDHLTTRLHRSADSLLVISGVREEDRITSPAPLADVVRSAIAEIEGYQVVAIGEICTAVLSPQVVPDLRLVLAELLENATAFSPPGAQVEIKALLTDEIRILIIDHGIGISDDRMAEENRRLVERERLDVVPTSMLGLFVVGRLARRHNMRVRLVHSEGHGVTAEIRVPADLFTAPSRPEPQVPQVPANMAVGAPQGMLELPRYPSQAAFQALPALPALPMVEGSFEWFAAQRELAAGPSGAAANDRGGRGAISQTGAFPAIPAPAGRQLPPGALVQPPMITPSAPLLSPAALAGPPPAPAAPPLPPAPAVPPMPPGGSIAGPGGLARRNPGDNLRYFGLETNPAAHAAHGGPAGRFPNRDAEAERAELDAFAQGAAAAAAAPLDQTGPGMPPEYPLMSEYPPAAAPTPVAPAGYPVAPAGYPVAPPPEYPPQRLDPPTAPPQPSQFQVPQQRQEYATSPSPSYQDLQQQQIPQGYAAPSIPMQQTVGRGGLTRRVPGAQLSPALRVERPGARQQAGTRNAEAERDAMQSFLDGLARAAVPGPGLGSNVNPEESEKR